jgi:hypothetical protein
MPWRIMDRFDQWDWSPILDLGNSCDVSTPSISYLGGGRSFNQAQIEYPWAVKGLTTDVTWLWRYEDGALDWQKVMDAAGHSNMVITAPSYIGKDADKENLDNQHNAEFVSHLSGEKQFRQPIHLCMGRFEPVEVLVFMNNNLRCQPPRQAPVLR